MPGQFVPQLMKDLNTGNTSLLLGSDIGGWILPSVFMNDLMVSELIAPNFLLKAPDPHESECSPEIPLSVNINDTSFIQISVIQF